MKKTIVKKLAVTLAAVMTFGSVWITPGKAQAATKSFCYIAMECDTQPTGFPEDGYIYKYSEWDDPVEINNSWGGASYDVKTNTLTLNNFNNPDIGFIFDGMGQCYYGTDLKIVLIGKNAIKRIDDGFSGMDFEGSGSLTINENKTASGSAITFNKSWDEEDGLPKFHVGKDATVTIYSSPDNEYASGHCISIMYCDKETEKPEDYLVIDGNVDPEIQWEYEETYPAYDVYVGLTDALYVKTDYSTDRLFKDKDDSNAIRLLVEGKVSDSNETYAFVEKHNDKWYVSRSAWYDTGIDGAYSGTLPEDLKTGDNKISAYTVASSYNSTNYYDAYYVYTKDGKYYAIAPKCMLVDEWETAGPNDVYCMGEIVHDTPEFVFTSGEAYDPWIMDTYTDIDGVTTGEQADKYMTDKGYTKYVSKKVPASYNFNTKNDSLKFSPKQAPATPTPTPTPTPSESPAKASPEPVVSPSASPTTAPSAEPEVKKGDKATDDKTGITYTVTDVKDGKANAECKGPKSKKTKKFTIPSKYKVNDVDATVTSIGASAFANNKKLTTVKAPSTIKIIKKGAFKKCPKLNKFTVPKNVTEIQASAFENCSGMKKMTIKSKNITKIGKNAFKGMPKNAVIKVPSSCKKKYKKMLKKAGFKGKVK